jgi:hypothetical protein
LQRGKSGEKTGFLSSQLKKPGIFCQAFFFDLPDSRCSGKISGVVQVNIGRKMIHFTPVLFPNYARDFLKPRS